MAIESFTDPYWFLSNFSDSIIEWRGKTWRTVEHAYQAAKIYDPRKQNPVDEKMVEVIRAAATPREAKKLGQGREDEEWEKPHPYTDVDDDEPLKLVIMRELVHLKFEIPELRAQLLATGNQELIEGDKIWGVCDGEGTNWLGMVLMQERTEARNYSEFPKPRCCDAVQKWAVVWAKANETWRWNEKTKKAELVGSPTIKWELSHSSNQGFLKAFGYNNNYFEIPTPTHCPFCATKLPEFRQRAELPEPFCRPDDGYCLTCDERLMGCQCHVPQLRWEVVW